MHNYTHKLVWQRPRATPLLLRSTGNPPVDHTTLHGGCALLSTSTTQTTLTRALSRQSPSIRQSCLTTQWLPVGSQCTSSPTGQRATAGSVQHCWPAPSQRWQVSFLQMVCALAARRTATTAGGLGKLQRCPPSTRTPSEHSFSWPSARRRFVGMASCGCLLGRSSQSLRKMRVRNWESCRKPLRRPCSCKQCDAPTAWQEEWAGKTVSSLRRAQRSEQLPR